MEKQIDLSRLQDFFSEEDLEWKPVATSRKTGKGLAAVYVPNRAIMDRLDEVCGPENWKNEFQPGPDGGVLCGLSIRVGDEWVTKWDGAENTDIESVKGGLSSSMRRAAVHWGIGRYLYRVPSHWVPIDQHGRFAQQPKMPSEFLPPRAARGAAGKAPSIAEPEAANGQRAAPPRNGRGRAATADIDQYRMPG